MHAMHNNLTILCCDTNDCSKADHKGPTLVPVHEIAGNIFDCR